MSAPDAICKLVDRFDDQLDSYRSPAYKEASVRSEFIDYLFAELGWDVGNKQGLAEAYKEVIVEPTLAVEQAAKAPDYAFRIGGAPKFFVEAKKPAVNLRSDIHAALQVRRYGWTAKMPLSVLTDFDEFAVYDTRIRPTKEDRVDTALVVRYAFHDYCDKWDEIAGVFSKAAILHGSFDKYVGHLKTRRGSVQVDDAFLAEIERWREILAKNIEQSGNDLSVPELNYAVQMIIDRIVFLRICEDRGIEPEDQLRSIVKQSDVYGELVRIFRAADSRYNSGLFHFKPERGQSSPTDDLTPKLKIANKPLQDLISNLYPPESSYAFTVIPPEILGQVYEQFLGKVIRLTAGRRVKIDEKPEIRKAGGVYYTPTNIVDYIVKNTVGRLLEGKTPKEVARVKILDPACGSGTFLIGAYQYLLDWHLNWYSTHDPRRLSRGTNPPIYQASGGWQLTLSKKKEILLNNIFAVDIDTQAVEVAKLSLLLKVVENPGQLELAGERILPDLGRNIQCGNSLIGPDYFEGRMLADDEERRLVNAFDWEESFPQVFAQGGFDVVIGNPPYGADFEDAQKVFLKGCYSYRSGKPESYIYFVEKAISLIRLSGLLGFIVPNAWLSNFYGQQLRGLILTKSCVLQVANLEPTRVFSEAIVDTVILVLQKGDAGLRSNHRVEILEGTPEGDILHEHWVSQSVWASDKTRLFNIMADDDEAALMGKIASRAVPLSEILEYSQGIIPYKTRKDAEQNPHISDTPRNSEWKPLLESAECVGRYSLVWHGQYLHYGRWLWCARDHKFFQQPKLLFHRIRKKLPIQLVATFDADGFYNRHALSNLVEKPGSPYNLKFLLGVFNSKLLNYWFVKRFGLLMEVGGFKIGELPICRFPLSDPADKARQDRIVSLVERMLELHRRDPHTPQEKETLAREIQRADDQIDRLVYELYGLTEEDIKIVEGQ